MVFLYACIWHVKAPDWGNIDYRAVWYNFDRWISLFIFHNCSNTFLNSQENRTYIVFIMFCIAFCLSYIKIWKVGFGILNYIDYTNRNTVHCLIWIPTYVYHLYNNIIIDWPVKGRFSISYNIILFFWLYI